MRHASFSPLALRSTAAIVALACLGLTAACATRPTTPATSAASTQASAPASTTGSQTGPSTTTGSAGQSPAGAGAMPSGTAGQAAGMASAAAQRAAVLAGLQSVGDRVFFDTDSSAISADAQTILRAQAAVLKANPVQRVMIAGNCDERGTREYNLALGARRANAVRDFLIGLGVSPAQMDTVSYGKERPIDARPNADGWAINRNGHTFILESR
jgi:peptidoglycan-associated lipoprotein